MEIVLRLTDETIEEFVKFIPPNYLEEYIYNDSMFFYGMKEDGICCGIAILETEFENVIIRELNTYGKDRLYIYRFVNAIAYDMSQQGMDRLVWKYIENDEFDYMSLLSNIGFVSYPGDSAMFTFSIKQLSDSEILNKPFSNVILLSEVGAVELKKLCTEIASNNKDLVEMPISMEKYIGDCSVIYNEEDIPKGMMLLEMRDNRLYIPYIYCNSTKPTAIIDMMRCMLTNARKKYGDDMVCTAGVIDPVLIQIIEKITGIRCKYQQIAVKELDYIAETDNSIKKEFQNMLLDDFV